MFASEVLDNSVNPATQQLAPLTNSISFAGDTTTEIIQSTSNPASQWRLVSGAAKFTLINNADENDGWFEAIRINPNWNTAAIGGFISPTVSNGTLSGGNAIPPTLLAPAIDWAGNPSYVTGRIRDLHNHIFKLNSNSADHDFILLGVGGAATPAKDLFDPTYDCIAIRFYGRGTAGSTTDPPTRLLMEFVSHQEVVYDEGSIMATVATRSTVASHNIRQGNQPGAASTAMVPITPPRTIKRPRTAPKRGDPTGRRTRAVPMRRTLKFAPLSKAYNRVASGRTLVNWDRVRPMTRKVYSTAKKHYQRHKKTYQGAGELALALGKVAAEAGFI